ncbi:hypothetical protein [Phorcysia thermohydrogeniphila]|uniref:Uncharacterized protein n=1 Tax=Phorcysia thermohydrogeniphila TaxID=936138 RepID=A0A4R1GB67_9BACT|nr:hypothetical protein [Phorcysia thermohydrogeniphila]TCK03941.1 hypothetical protein CLV27_1257 [Phorcysia thermohydrogeniphila]
MRTLEEIKKAVEELPPEEFAELKNWITELYWKRWDREIEKDSQEGVLDFLIEEALREKKDGSLRDIF